MGNQHRKLAIRNPPNFMSFMRWLIHGLIFVLVHILTLSLLFSGIVLFYSSIGATGIIDSGKICQDINLIAYSDYLDAIQKLTFYVFDYGQCSNESAEEYCKSALRTSLLCMALLSTVAISFDISWKWLNPPKFLKCGRRHAETTTHTVFYKINI